MPTNHTYQIVTTWTGNLGAGTAGYRAYERTHELRGAGKAAAIPGSSDPSFRGDPTRYNPEELFVSSLSACHMLWYLHLCAEAGVVVSAYRDEAVGSMVEHSDGAGEFERVTLRPMVTLANPEQLRLARDLHARAHTMCFIARSVRCYVAIEPTFDVTGER
jgi:organic hydroperoxide reductase OsmC/OhrA